MSASQVEPIATATRCDDCGAPESLLERGLFHVAGFKDTRDQSVLVQPDAWYCEECYWRFRDDYDAWEAGPDGCWAG